jgi:hypothetical protein
MEGRKDFAKALTDKLELLLGKIRHNDEIDEQLTRIHKKGKCSTREVILAGSVATNMATIEADDDVDSYVRQLGSGNDSGKPTPSQFSPGISANHSMKRRSPKSHSPERKNFNASVPSIMSQSCAIATSAYYNNGFAPPPGSFGSQTITPKIGNRTLPPYFSDCDTSGIASMATTNLSAPSTSSIEKQRAAIFQKARELSSAAATQSPRIGGSSKRRTGHDFSSLPRPKKGETLGESFAGLTVEPKLTIGYRENDIPFVAHIPYRQISFKEFRKYFSISSKNKKQFFFKTRCEDQSAPYQLLLVDDDSTILPIFEGKITAECKSLSDSD